MKEQILNRGEVTRKRKGFRYLWPAVCLWAATLLYASQLYRMNIKGCHYAWSQDSCFLKWEYSFMEFLKLCMGPNTFFISLTVLLWWAVLCLVAGVCLYFAFRNNEITVTDWGIVGLAAFGTRVQLPITSVLGAEKSFGHALKLNLLSGKVRFGDIQNREDVCRMIGEHMASGEIGEKQRVQIGARGLSTLKLAALCFLPCILLFLPILLWGDPSLGKAWETYWGWEKIRGQFGFLSYWLAEQIGQRGNWPIDLIYLAFPALLAGGFFFWGCRCQKILVTDSCVQGRGSFGAFFDLPFSLIKEVKQGCFHTVVLHHDHGKIRINGIKNRREVLAVLENSLNSRRETIEASKAPEAAVLKSENASGWKLGILCFLPAVLFALFLVMGIYRQMGFCREVYQGATSIRKNYAYFEYLLIRVLSGNPGRWIKALFWLSLVGIYGFWAYRAPMLTIKNGRIMGNSRSSGYLDIHVNSVRGVSVSPLGKLSIYTDSGRFIFGCMKNRSAFYEYFGNKFANNFNC